MNYWYSYLKEEFCIKYHVVIRFTVITKYIGNPVGANSQKMNYVLRAETS